MSQPPFETVTPAIPIQGGKRRRVLITTNMPSFYRVDLFNELAKEERYEFHIFFSTQKEENGRIWEEAATRLLVPYTFLESTSFIKTRKGIAEQRNIHFPKRLFRSIAEWKPSVIIASEYNPTSLMAFAYAKTKGIRFISWSDGTLNSERFISLPQRIARHIICRGSNALIASSHETRAAQVRYGANGSKIFTSFLTIDVLAFQQELDRLPKTKNSVPHLLFCGYLIRLKGIDLLFQALKDVRSEYILDIVGSGEELPALIQLAEQLGITRRVNFLGFKNRAEIVTHYRQADIFVFPSLNDAFGLVLVEALVARLPIITSIFAGGSTATVDPEVNGYIIDPNDRSRFTALLDQLLSNPDLRHTMSMASGEMANAFQLSAAAHAFLAAISASLIPC